MKRSKGFPSQTLWISGGAYPVKENMMSKKRKRELQLMNKLVLYEKAIEGESLEKEKRVATEKAKTNRLY